MKRKIPNDFNHDIKSKVIKTWKNEIQVFPSLKRLAVVNVISALYKQKDVHNQIQDIFRTFPGRNDHWERQIEWPTVSDAVLLNVQTLSLPQCLKDEVLNGVRPLGNKVMLAVEFQKRFLDWHLSNINYLFWTPYSSIDFQKMARLALTEGYASLNSKYIFACKYCLEDVIRSVWNQLPQKLQSVFKLKAQEGDYTYCMSAYWTCWVTGNFTALDKTVENHNTSKNLSDSRLGYMALYALEKNEFAFRYFWQRLTPDEKNKNIVRFTWLAKELDDDDGNVLSFLLSTMNETQLEEYFRQESPSALVTFLGNWQWTHLFPVIAKRVLLNISQDDLIRLIYDVTYYIFEFEEDRQLPFLRTLISDSSLHLRECWLDSESDLWATLDILFALRDAKTIRAILDKASNSYKEELVKSSRGVRRCTKSLQQEQFHFLDKVLDFALTSTEKRQAFKKDLLFHSKMKLCLTFTETFKIEKILHWCLGSELETINFKGTLPYTYNKTIFAAVLNREVFDDDMNNYLLWCFDGDESCLRSYKYFLPYANKEKMQMEKKHRRKMRFVVSWCFLGNRELLADCFKTPSR